MTARERAHRTERESPGQLERECSHCGRTLYLWPKQLRPSGRHFCDQACWVAARADRQRESVNVHDGVARVLVVSRMHGDHYATIDAGDLPLVSAHVWYLTVSSNGKTKYAHAKVGNRTIQMHRLIMGMPDSRIDHRDLDGLNNQRSNLRLATHAQNLANTGPNSRSKSGVRGVSWDKSRGKWTAFLKHRNLGRFDTLDEAKAAYDEAARAEYGEYARA